MTALFSWHRITAMAAQHARSRLLARAQCCTTWLAEARALARPGRVLHQFENSHKTSHHINVLSAKRPRARVFSRERTGSPDQLVPYEVSLEDAWELLVTLSEGQYGLGIQERQEPFDQLRSSPNHPLRLRLLRSHYFTEEVFFPKHERALTYRVLTIEAVVSRERYVDPTSLL